MDVAFAHDEVVGARGSESVILALRQQTNNSHHDADEGREKNNVRPQECQKRCSSADDQPWASGNREHGAENLSSNNAMDC
jgi:hypothetical protein